MQNILLAFLAFSVVGLSQAADKEELKSINNAAQSLDYKFLGKKEEFRFGVELKENKQFHHTKTDEDGVRLGCYGHEQDGKEYLTHYVADGKGYRLVPHQSVITVYPKDGGEPRQASFVDAFSKEEIKSANVKYLFPGGCKSPVIEYDAPVYKSSLANQESSSSSSGKAGIRGGKAVNLGAGSASTSLTQGDGKLKEVIIDELAQVNRLSKIQERQDKALKNGAHGGVDGADLSVVPIAAIHHHSSNGNSDHSNGGAGNGIHGSIGADGGLNGNSNTGKSRTGGALSGNALSGGALGASGALGSNARRGNGALNGGLNGNARDGNARAGLTLTGNGINSGNLHAGDGTGSDHALGGSIKSGAGGSADGSTGKFAGGPLYIPAKETETDDNSSIDGKLFGNSQVGGIAGKGEIAGKGGKSSGNNQASGNSQGVGIAGKGGKSSLNNHASGNSQGGQGEIAGHGGKSSHNNQASGNSQVGGISGNGGKSSSNNPSSGNSANSKIELTSNVFNADIKTPFKSLSNGQCSDTCCDDNRPQILLSRATPGSCCTGVSKLVVPIDMEKLAKIATSEIIEITNETNTATLLKKLLKLVEQHDL